MRVARDGHAHPGLLASINDILKQSAQMRRAMDALVPLAGLPNLERAARVVQSQQEAMARVIRSHQVTIAAIQVPRLAELTVQLPSLRFSSDLVSSAMAVQEALRPAIELQRSLQDVVTIVNNPMRLLMEQISRDREHLGEIVSRVLSQRASILGELEYIAPNEEPDFDALAEPERHDDLLVPPSVHERLVEVRFLPLRLMDRVLRDPRLMHSLRPRQFEELVAQLMDGIGFSDVVLTPQSGDEGRDIVAVNHVNGIPVLFAVECKRYSERNKVGVGAVRGLLGTITATRTAASVGVLATTSFFTKPAARLILSEPRLDGRDFTDLVAWLADYARKKGISV